MNMNALAEPASSARPLPRSTPEPSLSQWLARASRGAPSRFRAASRLTAPGRLRAWIGFAVCLLGLGVTALAADTEPPTRPVDLTLTAKTATSITLAWTASSDDTGVTAYDIWRDGVLAGTATSNAFICSGLTANRAYTFRVRARDEAGNVSDPSNALLATPQAGVSQVQPALIVTHFNALVLNYDPFILVNGSSFRASAYYGYRNVDSLIQQYIDLMRKASGGQITWSVSDRFELDEFPAPADHSRPALTASNYVTLRAQGYDYWNNPTRGPDYSAIIQDPRFGIVNKVNGRTVDAIWMFGPGGTGFYETAMAGPSAFYVNGGPVLNFDLTRNVVFYGFGKEGHQGVGFMCENTCHMTEVIIRDRIAPSWPRTIANPAFTSLNLDNLTRALAPTPVNDWTHFTQAEAASWDPVLVAPGHSGVGLSHFAPTAMHNYNWSTFGFDFHDAGPFKVYDGTWSTSNQEYRVLAGNGVKVLALDGLGLREGQTEYHPAIAFSDADVEVTVRVLNGANSAHAGFLFRVMACQTGANQVKGYYVGLNPYEDKVILAKLNNAFIPLTNVARVIQPNVSYRLRVEARRSQIQVYLNGEITPVLSFDDDSYVTGGFGFSAYSTEAYFNSLRIVAHTPSDADKWYQYPAADGAARDLSPLEWNGDQNVAMDGWYAWWWEHLPKNGGGHYATDLLSGNSNLLLNTWWPYVFDVNRFTNTCPFPDIVFPLEDVTPPEPPTSVGGLALGASRVALCWNEAADNIGVTRYAVFRNGAFLRMTALPYLTDTRLSPNTPYTYCIKSCDGSGNQSPATAPVTITTLPKDSEGALLNGGFEVRPEVTDWATEAFVPSAGLFTWEPPGTGRRGTRCVSITATQFNDARWMQTVSGLTPGAAYWLSGWIKGSNIVREPGRATAANLCLNGTWEHAPDYLDGTFDWRQVSFSFAAPSSGIVTIGCRLGYWSNTTSGKAWFDDLVLIPATELRLNAPRVLTNAWVQFELIAGPGRPYRIDTSSNLTGWGQLQTVNPAHPVTEITDNFSPLGPARFYRAVRSGSMDLRP